MLFSRAKPFDSRQLIGKWRRQKIARRDPSAFRIKDWVMEFGDSGKWQSSGFMIGPWDSLELRSSGTWRLAENQIFFNAGNGETESGITLDGDKLCLFDDPLITPRLGKSAEFLYTRFEN